MKMFRYSGGGDSRDQYRGGEGYNNRYRELDQYEVGISKGGEEFVVVLTIVKYLSESIILAIGLNKKGSIPEIPPSL